jgi:hypothetical protein
MSNCAGPAWMTCTRWLTWPPPAFMTPRCSRSRSPGPASPPGNAPAARSSITGRAGAPGNPRTGGWTLPCSATASWSASKASAAATSRRCARSAPAPGSAWPTSGKGSALRCGPRCCSWPSAGRRTLGNLHSVRGQRGFAGCLTQTRLSRRRRRVAPGARPPGSGTPAPSGVRRLAGRANGPGADPRPGALPAPLRAARVTRRAGLMPRMPGGRSPGRPAACGRCTA